ncbi:NRAMP family divalent metal transporter [Campylobacter troglodytis]|uniref:NRAMP family divalent metal transporter n=1 Tax=Campylobacter troglodytis TaxID=654363 RepID=UPI001156D644|nr:NRAMP family divalent metal transporter [Campylobacter troglodytis]TQR60245.1 hypothetical protein DMC01_06670 [Campylobacter troglodytis]
MKQQNAVLAAAFLMATSAIGPGFLTQTAAFTATLLASFAFVILVSIVIDLIAQLNIWRIIVLSGKRAQVLANEFIPGAGYLLSFLVFSGGFVFNIANIAGAGLGLSVLLDLELITCSLISTLLAIFIFAFKRVANLMDRVVIVAGFLMIILTAFVAFSSKPPVLEALKQSIMPSQIDLIAIVTLVGGTVGGYIVFSGAHRLIDTNKQETQSLARIDRSAISGILLTALMRILLFLAVLGVLNQGFVLDPKNPAGSAFEGALGVLGAKFFGAVLFLAALSSIIGAAYTSISFIVSFNKLFERHKSLIIICFILASFLILFWLEKSPTQLLILAGTINGWILPLSLFIMIKIANKQGLINKYKHPKLLSFLGLIVVILMSFLALYTMIRLFYV